MLLHVFRICENYYVFAMVLRDNIVEDYRVVCDGIIAGCTIMLLSGASMPTRRGAIGDSGLAIWLINGSFFYFIEVDFVVGIRFV